MNIALWTAMYITLRNQRQIAEAEEEHKSQRTHFNHSCGVCTKNRKTVFNNLRKDYPPVRLTFS